jgi:hypothetical protein
VDGEDLRDRTAGRTDNDDVIYALTNTVINITERERSARAIACAPTGLIKQGTPTFCSHCQRS